MTNQVPKIGLALGGGGAKAVVQLGVLKSLIKHRIPISHVRGSSMGAILAGMFARGLAIDEIQDLCLDFFSKQKITDFNNLNLLLSESLFKTDYTKRFLKKIFGDHRLEGCPIPLAVTAVDLESGREVIFETGPMVEAITASTAIPGVFNPVYLDGHYLVDGGLLEDSPILSLRRSGQCDLIIGTRIVDNASRQFISGMIYHKYLKKGRFTPQKIGQKIQAAWGQLSADTQLMFQIIFRSITIVREELFQYSVKEAKPDLFLEFEMSDVEIFQFEKFQEMITKGEQKMDQQITHLLGLLKEMQPQQVQDKE